MSCFPSNIIEAIIEELPCRCKLQMQRFEWLPSLKCQLHRVLQVLGGTWWTKASKKGSNRVASCRSPILAKLGCYTPLVGSCQVRYTCLRSMRFSNSAGSKSAPARARLH